jgi:tetratricopeptide (TPR) repeat protein
MGNKDASAQDVDETSAKQQLARRLQNNPNDFFANLQMGRLLFKENDRSAAEPYLQKAAQLFPEFVEPGNPYQLLSEIYLSEQRESEALTQFLAWSRIDENTTVPLVQAASIYRNRKDWKSMAGMLESSVYINPYDESVYTGLGNAAMEAGDGAAAAAAYQALLGLKTSDPAQAHYDLARAWFACGKKQDARREVLRSLEIAPSYIEAQELLLKLSGGNP